MRARVVGCRTPSVRHRRQAVGRVSAVSERSSCAGPGCGVASFLAPSHPPGRILAWSTEKDRLGEAAVEPVHPAVRDDLGRSERAAPVAPLRIRHGPLLPLSYGIGSPRVQ
jgi:hypothetical protein